MKPFERMTLAASVLATAVFAAPGLGVQFTQLTHSAPPYNDGCEDPAWSRDGKRLAYTLLANSGPPIYEGLECIAFHDPWEGASECGLCSFTARQPTWSPDGSRIASVYAPYGAIHPGLWTLSLESCSEAQVAQPGDRWSLHPDWSPTEDVIAVDYERRIWLLTLAGGMNDLNQAGTHPAWSPDASRIAFCLDGNIWTLQLASHSPTRITDSGLDCEPTWSPDGKWIAFSSGRGGSSDIWVVSSTGGTAVRLTQDSADDHSPAWSPDGDRIAFVSNRGGVPYDIWLASELPDFTVAATPTSWSQVKNLYR